MDNVRNADTARRLMRHTSLDHDTLHETRQRSHAGSGEKLGQIFWGKFLYKTKDNISGFSADVGLRQRNEWEGFGGGGGSRTHDAADMSRVDSDEDC
jgi:hypothetical protein